MKKITHVFSVLFLFISIFIGVAIYEYRSNDGFYKSRIYYPLKVEHQQTASFPCKEELEAINEILNQPFHYIAHGCQAFVFRSEDGKHVVKFAKSPIFPLSDYSFLKQYFPSLQKYLEDRFLLCQNKVRTIFAAWSLADKQLKHETALEYVHMYPTRGIHGTTTFIDKKGQTHEIDLDTPPFLLQRYTINLNPYLDELIEEGKTQQAIFLVHQLIEHLVSEYKKGIYDIDPEILRNAGVTNNLIVQYDVGNFITDESIKSPEIYLPILVEHTKLMRQQLHEKDPLLGEAFDIKISALLSTL
ncbi:MAG: hypothetical protein CMO81_06215 [Waddliaceae bacterium]|nr:hypothetical protein [Waddliaceae bacterium]